MKVPAKPAFYFFHVNAVHVSMSMNISKTVMLQWCLRMSKQKFHCWKNWSMIYKVCTTV